MNAGVARVRDAFRVEPLEPRVLLSADPVFSPLAALFLPEERELHDKLSAAEQLATGETSLSSPGAMLGMLASVPSVAVDLQTSTATQAMLALADAGQGSVALNAADAGAGLPVGFSVPEQDLWQPQVSADGASLSFEQDAGQGLTVSWGQAGMDAWMPEWQLDLQSAANPQLQQPSLQRVERLTGQSFDLAKLPALDAGTDLWVGADAALKGSGAFYGDLTVEGLLSPGYSPG
ncbi:MAG: LEPR-XLL domain-containing protein, partial [Betaproteobacteria bacterium]